MNIAIVGLGLIGGSIGIRLKETQFFDKVIGVEKNESHQNKALQLGLVDEIQSLDSAIENCKIIVLTVPVDTILAYSQMYWIESTSKSSLIWDQRNPRFLHGLKSTPTADVM